MSDPATALRALLPGSVAIGTCRIGRAGTLWPEEAAAMANARTARLAEFAAGRGAARTALAGLGRPAKAIQRGPHGLPDWPMGIIGSIAHAGGWAIAAVAPQDAIRAIGLDAEVMGADLPLAEVADPAEIAALAGRDPILLFSAKEAAYKAQFPLSGVMFGFHDIDLRLTPGGFTATFRIAAGPFVPGDILTGRQAVAGGLVLSSLVIEA